MARLTQAQLEGLGDLIRSERRRLDERSQYLQSGSRPVRLWNYRTARETAALPATEYEPVEPPHYATRRSLLDSLARGLSKHL